MPKVTGLRPITVSPSAWLKIQDLHGDHPWEQKGRRVNCKSCKVCLYRGVIPLSKLAHSMQAILREGGNATSSKDT